MSEPYVCHFCGAVLSETDAHEFDDIIMCEHCLDEHTTLCDNCLESIWKSEAEGMPSYALCRYCYENNYCNCEECGRLIHNDDAVYSDDNDEPYCQSCYDKLYSGTIKNYHPELIAYLKTKRLYINEDTAETEEY